MASTPVRYPTPNASNGSPQHTSVGVTDPLLCPPGLDEVVCVSSVPPWLSGSGGIGASVPLPRAVPVVWNSIHVLQHWLHTTLVVATISILLQLPLHPLAGAWRVLYLRQVLGESGEQERRDTVLVLARGDSYTAVWGEEHQDSNAVRLTPCHAPEKVQACKHAFSERQLHW